MCDLPSLSLHWASSYCLSDGKELERGGTLYDLTDTFPTNPEVLSEFSLLSTLSVLGFHSPAFLLSVYHVQGAIVEGLGFS